MYYPHTVCGSNGQWQDYMIAQVSSSMESFNMFIVIQLIQRWCEVTHHLLLMVVWEDSLIQD